MRHLAALALSAAVVAGACSAGPTPEPTTTPIPAPTLRPTQSPRPLPPLVIDPVDFEHVADLAGLVAASDLVVVVSLVEAPRSTPVSPTLASWTAHLRIEETLRGASIGNPIQIGWLGVAPELDNYIVEAELEKLSNVVGTGASYLMFLHGPTQNQYGPVGHLQGILDVGLDGRVAIREGGIVDLDGLALAQVAALVGDVPH